jgi:diguanylate cyclase (GGDEF)-like protein
MQNLQLLFEKLDSERNKKKKVDLMNALAWELKDWDQKRGAQLAQTALELAESVQYEKGIAESMISICQFNFSDYVLALSQSLKSLETLEKLNEPAGQARALYTLCWAHWGLDNFAEAIEVGQRAQKLARQIGDKSLEADILNNLGLAYKRSGNYEPGYAAYEESLSLYRLLDNPHRQSKILTNIALAYITQGQYQKALIFAGQSAALMITNAPVVGYNNLAFGQIYAGMKEYPEAIEHLEKAIEFGRAREISQLTLTALHTLGEIYIEINNEEAAFEHLSQVLVIASELKSDLYLSGCHETLARFYESKANLACALEHYKKFHHTKEKLFNDKNATRIQSLLIFHQTELAHREAEIYHIRNIELEQEIAKRKEIERQLHQQATTDELTRITNRRHFLELATYEIKRSLRFASPLSIALIDIDKFKSINDTYGHASGDQVLTRFASLLCTNLREIDIPARFGGDEFVVLFPGATLDIACQIMERIRVVLKKTPFITEPSPVFITVSVGMAAAEKQETLENMLERADQALYHAKSSGRNQVSKG